jgi:acetyl-CoA synthetase
MTFGKWIAKVPLMTKIAGTELEDRLESLLEVTSFPPPKSFASAARWNDPAVYAEAEADPEAWWDRHARALHWDDPWHTVLDWSDKPFAKWYLGGKINASYNCVDRHVAAGNGDRVAFYWRGEEGEERRITYAWLLDQVQRAANALTTLGVGSGDVVGIYLPMIPEVVVAMLACARVGAPHNVVFGGFAVEAVRERMDESEAKVLITVDGARRRGKTVPVKRDVDPTLGSLSHLSHVLVVRHTGAECSMTPGRDVDWDEALAAADPVAPATPFDAEHPLFILYSSGSTAKPKGILHTTGGYLVGTAYTTKYVFDLRPETDVFWCSADVGWVTGHSYIVYGPLLNGATSVMYEGAPDYPNRAIWWDTVERYKASIFYTAPTAIRACMSWGAEEPNRHDLSSLRLLGSVGEPINPKAWLWYHQVIGGGNCPVVDTWWQTETGQIMISPIPGLTAAKPGCAMRALPGISAEVVDNDGNPVPEGQGLLVLRRPWPGMLRTLYKDPERFLETYWQRFGTDTYLVGDAARLDADGDIWILGRIDDVINVSGHRLSTAEVESAIVNYPRVAEAAVVAQDDELTGQAIVAFVTPDEGTETDHMDQDIRDHVAEHIGKLARPKRIIWTYDLPKTRSGKIMRRLLRDIAAGRELGDVTTLRDPAVTDKLREIIAERRDSED